MANKLPRGSFQKLGLAASGFRTAFTSLTSSLTTLRTEGGGEGLTRRSGARMRAAGPDAAAGAGSDGAFAQSSEVIQREAGWHAYAYAELRSKTRYTRGRERFVDVPLISGANGVAVFHFKFAEGAERLAFRCTEVRRA